MSSVSGKTELLNLIPSIWSPNIYDELRNQLMIADVFSREYEGEISRMGQTVKVNTIVAPNGEILSNDKQTFNSEKMVVTQKEITVNKRAVASFEITDLADLQSMDFEREAQEALVYAIRRKIEQDVIDALVPSTSSPDHDIAPASASDLSAADLAGIRTLMSVAKVPPTNRFFFGDPQYYGDLLQKTNFISSDFVPSGSPVSSAMFSSPLYGFRIAESDILPTDTGYGVHPSALQMVIQKGVSIKISDLHGQDKFGYKISADIVYGFELFDNVRIVKISG